MIILVLILAAIFIFLLLLWNLLNLGMERAFRQTFGFPPPQQREGHTIRAFQPRVTQRLRELAATVTQSKEEMRRIEERIRGFSLLALIPLIGLLTEDGREFFRNINLYSRFLEFQSAISRASFFDFQVGQPEDYL